MPTSINNPPVLTIKPNSKTHKYTSTTPTIIHSKPTPTTKRSTMFPPKTLTQITTITNIAYNLGAIPYRFVKHPTPNNPNHKKIIPSFTTARTIVVHSVFTINLMYISFVAYRIFAKLYSNDDDKLTYVVTMTFKFCGYAESLVLQFNTLYMWREIPQFQIRYLEYFSDFHARFAKPNVWGPKCTKFFAVWIFVGIFVNFQNIAQILKKPHLHHFLTSTLSDPKHAPLVYRAPLLLTHLIVWFTSWGQVWAFCFHLYPYFCGVVWIVRELDINTTTQKTYSTLRTPQTFARTTRSLHLLHHFWRHTHQTWLCPAHKFVAICVATLGSYGVIKITGRQAFIMGAMSIITLLYLSVLFGKFGQLQSVSIDMRFNWVNNHDSKTSKWIKRFVVSVPDFKVKIGSFYYVERTTVFTIMETVLDNTITLLLL